MTEPNETGEAKATGAEGGSSSHPFTPSFLLPFSSKGALLGVDYGTKRIGLAECDPDRIIASPLDTVYNNAAALATIAAVVARGSFVGIVVGLPLHASGEESPMSAQARAFAAKLAEATNLPFVMWDERWTSHAAEDALFNAGLKRHQARQHVDSVAAQLILRTFIDAGCPPHGSDAPQHETDAHPDDTTG